MIVGLTGVKIGMTRYFTAKGISIPVTLIKIEPHRVTQMKTLKKDGYCAIQVTAGSKKISRTSKPEAGQFIKAGVEVGKGLWEFRFNRDRNYDNEGSSGLELGRIITISLFESVKKVDITGKSKGKGFSGTVKRWNFCSQDASHGNSLSHRAPGSIGQNQTPGKVFKGKKMAGQLGNERVTIQNLDVVHVDLKNNLLFIRGSVPGEITGMVQVKISVKNV